MTDRPVDEPKFVPLPDPWPDAPVCILGMFTSCDDCCTRETGGDLCAKCDKEYKRIANFLRPYISTERERADIAHQRCVDANARAYANEERARKAEQEVAGLRESFDRLHASALNVADQRDAAEQRAERFVDFAHKALTQVGKVREGYDVLDELLAQHEERGVELEDERARGERFREALAGLIARFRDHSNMEATPPWCRYVDHVQDMCACDEIAAEIERALQPDTEDVSAKNGQPSKADKLLSVLREIESYHVQLVSKRKRRNDPAQSWTVKVCREAIDTAEGRCTYCRGTGRLVVRASPLEAGDYEGECHRCDGTGKQPDTEEGKGQR